MGEGDVNGGRGQVRLPPHPLSSPLSESLGNHPTALVLPGTPPGAGLGCRAGPMQPLRACAVEGLKEAGDWYASECVRGGGVRAERGTTTGAGRRGRGDAPRRRRRGRWDWCLEAPEQRIPVLLPQQRECRARPEDDVPFCSSPFFFFFK